MKIHLLVIPVAFLGALALTHPAHSDTIPIKGHNTDQVQGRCNEGGGHYFGPGNKGGSYGCLNDDGTGIVCGGTGDNYKNTCDTFARAPKRTKLPTRAEAQAEARKAVNK